MWTIAKEFRFEAAHRLDGLAEGHKCTRPHGHSYAVVVEVAAPELDATGFVADFGELAPFGEYLAESFDHQDLNAVLPGQPSSELLAFHLYHWCREHLPERVSKLVVAVTVSETARTRARYQP